MGRETYCPTCGEPLSNDPAFRHHCPTEAEIYALAKSMRRYPERAVFVANDDEERAWRRGETLDEAVEDCD